MSYDPYTSDSGYVRFHLVRMIAEKLPPFSTTEEVIGLLEALSAYIAAGSTPPDEDEGEPTTAEDNIVVTRNPGGYI